MLIIFAYIHNHRQEGIAFDACGVGADGINDKILESLSDGRYYFLKRNNNFVRQLALLLKNVKVPKIQKTGSYKLTGFEKSGKRGLSQKKMTTAEAGVALYHFQANPE